MGNGFKEECWVMRGLRIGSGLWLARERYASKGNGGSVGFDWEGAWDDRRLVGWRHTHPGVGFVTPSSIDDRTMVSWVKASGRPMLCGVTCGPQTKYYLYERNRHSHMILRSELGWRKVGPAVLAWEDRGLYRRTCERADGGLEDDATEAAWTEIKKAFDERRSHNARW